MRQEEGWNFFILLLSQIDQDLPSRVLNVQQTKNSSTIIGNCNIANIIHHHLIQPRRTKRALDDIRDGLRGKNYSKPSSIPRLPTRVDKKGDGLPF